VSREFGLEVKNDVDSGVAFCFAGGIGGTGSVCGAVAGAVMAIGLKLGRGQTMDESLSRMATTREFRRRFEAEMKSVNCRDLTGADLTTPEGRAQLMTTDTATRVCLPAVGTGFRIAVELLNEIGGTRTDRTI
jgi:C_GCAxxG_C_C family probable redox protein